MNLVVGMGSNVSFRNIRNYLGLSNKKLSVKQQELIDSISLLLTAKGVDAETAVSIFQSFENKISRAEGVDHRLSSFNKFIQSISSKDDLVETIKDFGLMSKAELEQKAVETGNWIPFMKRVESDKQKEIADANQPNELGSKATVQPLHG